jgi:sulfur-oxidizing protein SoxY
MTNVDYVKAVHIISEANPSPNIFTAYFTPRSGRAELTTRVRLADSQRVWAIAQMNDGSYWQGYADTLVTLSACTEMI